MKALDAIFPHPVKVVQLYCNTYLYTKHERSYSQRKKNELTEIQSKTGFIANNELYLPEIFFEYYDIKESNLVTMEDYCFNREYAVFRGQKEISGYTRGYDITETTPTSTIQLKQDGTLELYYASDKHPKKKNFKISDLKLHNPIEVKTNDKFFNALEDTTRFLTETSRIYEYAGEFTCCHVLREPFDPILKKVPANRKVVNLLKQIWM